jgi:hypothetical protein
MRGWFVAGNQAALFGAANLRKDNEERREGKSTEESRNCETEQINWCLSEVGVGERGAAGVISSQRYQSSREHFPAR